MKHRLANRFLRSVMSLALLPAKQIWAVHREILQYLDDNKVAYSDKCREFMEYVQPEEWSMYREEKRTINDLKGECAISCCSTAKIHKKSYWHKSKNSKTIPDCLPKLWQWPEEYYAGSAACPGIGSNIPSLSKATPN